MQNPLNEGEKLLYSFVSQEDLTAWTVFSDQEYGGKSTAELSMSDSESVSSLLHAYAHACLMTLSRAQQNSVTLSGEVLPSGLPNISAGPCYLPWQHIVSAGGRG